MIHRCLQKFETDLVLQLQAHHGREQKYLGTHDDLRLTPAAKAGEPL